MNKDEIKLRKYKSKLLVRILRLINGSFDNEKTRENLVAIQCSFWRMANKDLESMAKDRILVNNITRQTKIKFVSLCRN